MTTLDCAELREVAAELVLGIASGQERGAAVAHLAVCTDCQAHVRELTAAADTLLLLAPPAEPPSGFESRVLEQVGAPRRRRRPRLMVAGAAVVVVAVLAVVVLTRGNHESLRTAQLLDNNGHSVGEAFMYDGESPWLFVSIEEAPDDNYRVELELTGGQVLRQPAPRLEGGAGSWGRTLRLDPDRIRVLRVVGDTGWRCAATFD
jgi:hypothetical protein